MASLFFLMFSLTLERQSSVWRQNSHVFHCRRCGSRMKQGQAFQTTNGEILLLLATIQYYSFYTTLGNSLKPSTRQQGFDAFLFIFVKGVEHQCIYFICLFWFDFTLPTIISILPRSICLPNYLEEKGWRPSCVFISSSPPPYSKNVCFLFSLPSVFLPAHSHLPN